MIEQQEKDNLRLPDDSLKNRCSNTLSRRIKTFYGNVCEY